MTVSAGRLYTGGDIARLTPLTYRRIDYWARTGVLIPSVCAAFGPGTRRRYSERDVLLAAIACALTPGIAGNPLGDVRRTMELLADPDVQLDGAIIVIDSEGPRIAYDGPTLVQLLHEASGAVTVLAVDHVIAPIRERLAA